MITQIKLKNFQLFDKETINLEKINIVTGINNDDTESSSNGSGKSTIINAIFFGLFGDVPGMNLKDLMRLGTKETEVELTINYNKDEIKIIRKLPAQLIIYLNGNEVVANTATLKQKFITDYFYDADFFRKFRTIDTIKGINILDLGITSLRKVLMEFIDDNFSNIRKQLQNKKLERETYNKDKRFYKFCLSEKRLKILTEGINKRIEFQNESNLQCCAQANVCSDLQSKIQTIVRLMNNNQRQKAEMKSTGICPILKKPCSEIKKEISKEQEIEMNTELEELKDELNEFSSQYEFENSLYNEYVKFHNTMIQKNQHTKSRLMQLETAFKFKDYKYTNSDVTLYNESIKTLDSFAGYYINEWLTQLAIIINNLLEKVNLEVIFSSDKDFLKIKNGENELRFEQLSSGQKIFLNAIFKIAILLHKGETTGILVCDEGLSSLDKINLSKFLSVCSELQYQLVIIYQNIEEVDANVIKVVRNKGVSNVQ